MIFISYLESATNLSSVKSSRQQRSKIIKELNFLTTFQALYITYLLKSSSMKKFIRHSTMKMPNKLFSIEYANGNLILFHLLKYYLS